MEGLEVEDSNSEDDPLSLQFLNDDDINNGTNHPPLPSSDELLKVGVKIDNVPVVSTTVTELQQTDWSTANNAQAVELKLLKKVNCEHLESYLPSEYWTSAQYNHVLLDKKPQVIKQVMKKLDIWVEKEKAKTNTYVPPPKSHILCYLYVQSYHLLWDSGFQRQIFIAEEKKKGHNYSLGTVYNLCPCHSDLKNCWEQYEFLHHRYSGVEKHLVPYCNCTSHENNLFYRQMFIKSKLCIYHQASFQYLSLMYGDPSQWENSESNDEQEDNDEIELVQVVPPNKDLQSTAAKRKTDGKKIFDILSDDPVPRKKLTNSSKPNTIPPKKKTLIEKGQLKKVVRKSGVTTGKSPPTKKIVKAKQKDSSLTQPPPSPKPTRGRTGKAKKSSLQNFPKIIERKIYDHCHWKNVDHPHLYETRTFPTNTQRRIYKNTPTQLKYECSVDSNLYPKMFDNGKYCDEFDRISALVGTHKIDEHRKDELLPSYFNREALHILSPNNIDLCYQIIGINLKRYLKTEVRETSEKVGTSNLNQEPYEQVDPRFNTADDIDQAHLLEHFISAVVVLNPVWDIGLQNMTTKGRMFEFVTIGTDNLTMETQCPCSKRFRKWRSSYFGGHDYDYPIDKDKVGFKECNSGAFQNFIEFYKHLNEWESKCYYHEAMVDIINVLYPKFYEMVITKKYHTQLLKLQGLKAKKTKVGFTYPHFTSLFKIFEIER